MAIIIPVFIVMLIIVAIMAVGVIMGRKPIAGSCGGLSAIGMKQDCAICGGDDDACEKEQLRQQKLKADLAYDATKAE